MRVFPATLFEAIDMMGIKPDDVRVENAFIVGAEIGGIIGNKTSVSK